MGCMAAGEVVEVVKEDDQNIRNKVKAEGPKQ